MKDKPHMMYSTLRWLSFSMRGPAESVPKTVHSACFGSGPLTLSEEGETVDEGEPVRG